MSWVLRLGIGLGAGLLTCVLLAIFGGGGCSICAGSLLEFIEKAKHYDSVEAMKAAVKDKTLYQDSDFGVCRMEYTVL